MHTFVGKTCRIHYNPDLSGDSFITEEGSGRVGPNELTIDAEDLLKFAADVIRRQLVAKVEDASCREILGLVGRLG